jgi:hypothetical protein
MRSHDPVWGRRDGREGLCRRRIALGWLFAEYLLSWPNLEVGVYSYLAVIGLMASTRSQTAIACEYAG